MVTEPAELENAIQLLTRRYPQQISAPPMPTDADIRIFRVTPVAISVLDYSKGFAHTDLVTW